MPLDGLFALFRTSPKGLTEHEARLRLKHYGHNELGRIHRRNIALQFALKFINPLVVVLLIIGTVSAALGDVISAAVVLTMAVLSVCISFAEEYRAGKEAEKLRDMVKTTVTVIRNGTAREMPLGDLVPGDIVELVGGDMVPADVRIVASKDLSVDQSTLTGESLPVVKCADPQKDARCAAQERGNIAFMGTSVVSGSATVMVLKTGGQTEFGAIARSVEHVETQTTFDRGIRSLSWLMIQATIVLVLVIFGVNAFFRGNVIQSLLFSLAVAVGLMPEMLPMVVALNLAKGAIAMAKKKVIVKHNEALENFGSMDVLCTDKTGTLTLNKIVLERYCDVEGKTDEEVIHLALLNSLYQTGLKDLLDRTILDHRDHLTGTVPAKIDEIPFDFSRRILSVVVANTGKNTLIAKGAPEEIFKRCTHYELGGKIHAVDPKRLAFLAKEYDSLSNDGFRVLAVAYRDLHPREGGYGKEDEKDLILRGYLAFLDPAKPTSHDTIQSLKTLGISVKVLTGDNAAVTRKICRDVGLDVGELLTGDDIEKMSDDVLRGVVSRTTVFARMSPEQKERVIRALRAEKHVVGYLGDGINDAPALKAADVGISVNTGADIAKESADIILLQKSLLVLRDGVLEGRRTFANILKYIKMGTSSSFGNMLSMTGASILLPFLPMLPIQILLNNFLYDFSQLAIPTDNVDEEELRSPRSWNMASIRRFMLVFGTASSLFDFLAFALLLFVFKATAPAFRTAWFMESLLTQTLVIYIIRTAKIPFRESRPSALLLLSSLFLAFLGVVIPFTPFAVTFGFSDLSPRIWLSIIGVVACYLAAMQWVKTHFIRRFGYS